MNISTVDVTEIAQRLGKGLWDDPFVAVQQHADCWHCLRFGRRGQQPERRRAGADSEEIAAPHAVPLARL